MVPCQLLKALVLCSYWGHSLLAIFRGHYLAANFRGRLFQSNFCGHFVCFSFLKPNFFWGLKPLHYLRLIHKNSKKNINCLCDFITTFLANPHFIVQISHVDTFKWSIQGAYIIILSKKFIKSQRQIMHGSNFYGSDVILRRTGIICPENYTIFLLWGLVQPQTKPSNRFHFVH